MIKKLRVPAFVILLMFIFSGTAAAYELNHRDVWVTDNGETTKYKTPSRTVEELFTKEGIILKDKDSMSVDIDDVLLHGMEIEIQRAANITIQAGGKSTNERVSGGIFVGKVIYDYSQKNGVEYVYGGELNEIVYDGMKINLLEKKIETVIERESVPYESSTVETDALDDGQLELAVEGKEGEKEITMEVTYLDGREIDRKVVGEVIVSEPIHEVIHLGIGRALGMQLDIEKLEYIRELDMEASAYTAGYDGTGNTTYTGMQVEYGVVSVDPNVIPLGTELYVDGYGYAIAADRGGAIKGNKIDLYYNTYDECIQFGRRQVKVYVLN